MKIDILILLFNTDVQYVDSKMSMDKNFLDVPTQKLLMNKMSIKKS